MARVVLIKRHPSTLHPEQKMPLAFDERQILESAHILKLTSAARAAGLRFKNGALSKADIINRLDAFPAMGKAAIAVLRRDEAMPPPPANGKSLPAEWDDEDPPTRSPRFEWTPPIEQQQSSESLEKKILDALNPLWSAIGKKADTSALHTAVHLLGEEISALQKELREKAPIQFIIKDREALPPVEGLTHPEFPTMIQSLIAGEHVFLKGPASSGKTTAARQAADVLAKVFKREDYPLKATGAVSDAYALLGFKNATGEYQRTAFRDAIEHGLPFLFDEIDGSAEDAVLVINSLDNGFIAFPDREIPVHPHFRLIAGGNTDGSGATMEFPGRRRMDGAFRDRFVIIDWQIDPRIEEYLSQGNTQWLAAVRAIRDYVAKQEILDVVATARATRRGPLLLAQGMSREKILEITCKRGALVDSWNAICNLPDVARFLQG